MRQTSDSGPTPAPPSSVGPPRREVSPARSGHGLPSDRTSGRSFRSRRPLRSASYPLQVRCLPLRRCNMRAHATAGEASSVRSDVVAHVAQEPNPGAFRGAPRRLWDDVDESRGYEVLLALREMPRQRSHQPERLRRVDPLCGQCGRPSLLTRLTPILLPGTPGSGMVGVLGFVVRWYVTLV